MTIDQRLKASEGMFAVAVVDCVPRNEPPNYIIKEYTLTMNAVNLARRLQRNFKPNPTTLPDGVYAAIAGQSRIIDARYYIIDDKGTEIFFRRK